MAGETTRQRYLEAVVECMLESGRTDLPLVTLARAAGTSDRMLVYYFKTREALVSEALDRIRSRRKAKLASALGRVPRSPDKMHGIVQVLEWMASSEDEAAVQFFFDAGSRGYSEDNGPFRAFLQGSIRDSVDEATLAARRMGADEAHAEAFGTMFTALAPSLAGDLLATGDDERIHRAIEAAARALNDSLVS